jgi:hypothetical protein
MKNMRNHTTLKIISSIIVFFISTGMIGESTVILNERVFPKTELLYDNIWGSIYNADTAQCDGTPNITGDGSIINPNCASEHRWIAVGQDMLYRESSKHFTGKIKYGDTVWIDSPDKNINGWWIVHDAKSSDNKYNQSIDFLQTVGDNTLYDGNRLWSGKFKNIKIYRFTNYSYKDLQKLL